MRNEIGRNRTGRDGNRKNRAVEKERRSIKNRGKKHEISAYMCVPSCAIVTVRVRQCTVLETTISDCSTTDPLALVHILLNVATAFACQGTV